MISTKLKKLVEGNPVALATVDTGEKPHVIAAAFTKVQGNVIVITGNFMQETVKNLKANSNAALVVWDRKWKGCEFRGTAKHYSSGKWLEFVKKMPENKGMPAKGAIVLAVKEIKKSK